MLNFNETIAIHYGWAYWFDNKSDTIKVSKEIVNFIPESVIYLPFQCIYIEDIKQIEIYEK